MSDRSNAQVQQLRNSVARTIASAVTMADQLGLSDIAASLREAEDAAKGDAEADRGHDRVTATIDGVQRRSC